MAKYHDLQKLTANTGLSYGCWGVDPRRNGDFTCMAWGPGLGHQHFFLSSGEKPKELPAPKGATLLLLWILESKCAVMRMLELAKAIEEAATCEVRQHKCLGITDVVVALMATSGMPSRHFNLTASYTVVDAVSKYQQVVITNSSDHDSSGDAILRCVLETLDPLIQRHSILNYQMTPHVGINHVCQLATCAGGKEALFPLIATELVAKLSAFMLTDKKAKAEANVTAKVASQTHQSEDTQSHNPARDVSQVLAEKFSKLMISLSTRIPHGQLQPDATAGETMIVTTLGPNGQPCYHYFVEDWGIRCPTPLPLNYVPVLRTVLPSATTLCEALDCMMATCRSIGTSDPLVEGVPPPQLYVVNTNGPSGGSRPCQVGFVRELALHAGVSQRKSNKTA